MKIDIKTSSCREGILTMRPDVMTIISDQDISIGDIINSPLHVDKDRKPIDFVIDDIVEQRKSKGDWKSPPPNMVYDKV